jgi:hypothetical protein
MQLARRDGVTRMVGQSRIERSYDAAMTDKMFGDHRRGAAAAFHAQMQRAHAARLEGAEDGTIASADGRDPLPELVMACGKQRSGHNVAVAVQIFPTTNHPQHLEDLNNDTSSLQYRPVPPLRSPDTIAMVGNRVGLLEFKTSPKPYSRSPDRDGGARPVVGGDPSATPTVKILGGSLQDGCTRHADRA